jgi:3,4-dihydroxy-9,10-secoandrosta-1,3,5(10)-triene-9,17-dione 4,5-dioxygenase
MAVKSLGYVIFNLKDPKSWVDYGTGVLGLVEGKRSGKTRFLRMDNAPFRFMLQQADADAMFASGFDCGGKAAYTRQIKAAFSSFSDPSGNQIEIFYGRDKGEKFKPGHGIKKFVTGKMGLGHVVLPAPAFDETSLFYRDLLGFGLSDDLTLPPFAPGMPDQHLHFMHAANPRHHTLALYNFPNPTGLIHVMVEVGSVDEVGCGLDRANAAGVPVIASIGRHAYENDHMFSFYMMGPGGFAVEYGCDGKQVADWSKYKTTVTTSGDVWGHEYNFPEPDA